ncbi:hypothetical protein [Geosporobacter ferrireducens]|uniref:DUF5673 domain-containing protein n=1 Tax=Geosporobacter ferrireducens TaxID=1424294 RepID=A0A1D8GHB8_9FIRM|nr:hypothetical protein [Geosporobacter ferrireducens]AOT70293.1 hypothetical protein Gferi_12220 [Geosporobacter ferrireducens]MTI55743.1 hypothetical protein [Geosporobacter ferrireducens]
MALLIRQTIRQQKIPFWKLLALIMASLVVMDIAISIFSKISPIAGSVAGMVTLIAAITTCFTLIYRQIAYFNYKLIQDELIMERVIGRANHLFLSLKLSELESIKTYDQMENNKVAKTYKFVSGKDTENWYVGEFTRSSDRYRFIFEPNEELKNAILSFVVEK